MTGAGELDQRVTIERPTSTPDGRGGSLKGWETVATVWAKVRPVRGGEQTSADKVEARALYRVTIRRRGDVTEACRVVWQGKAMNVRFIPDAGSRAPFTVIDCEAGVPA